MRCKTKATRVLSKRGYNRKCVCVNSCDDATFCALTSRLHRFGYRSARQDTMILNDLPILVDRLPHLDNLVTTLKAAGATQNTLIEGVAGSAKGFVLSRLFQRLQKPLLILTYQQEQAQQEQNQLSEQIEDH